MCSCVCVSDCVDACECGFVYVCCLSVYAGECVRVRVYVHLVYLRVSVSICLLVHKFKIDADVRMRFRFIHEYEGRLL